MINERVIVINGQPQLIARHAIYTSRPSRISNLYIQQPNKIYPTTTQKQINCIEGIPVIDEYEPQKGDPIVVEQAIFRGEVIKQGNQEKQVINQDEAIVSSEGYVSEDGEIWKYLPKIIMTVFKLGKIAIQTVTKIKAKFDGSLPNHKIMKITSANTEYYLGFRNDVYDQWFLKFVWAKLLIQKRECQEFDHQQKQIRDKIYKKSQILGEWKLRIVQIDSERGLRSFKETSRSASLQIESTKQIWTRFEQIKGGYFLVVKLWYGIVKLQFAVPTSNCLRWLHHFLSLLEPE